MYNQDGKEFENLLYEVLLIAFGAGEIIMQYHGNAAFHIKADQSPVTEADIQANHYITQRLLAISPYMVCSEEAVLSYDVRKDLAYYWLIDPLDGTKDFLAKNGNFTINIALIHQNRPILGVVYAPYFYEAYIGLLGLGSFSYNVNDFKTCYANNTINTNWLCEHKVKLDGNNVAQIYGEEKKLVLQEFGLFYENRMFNFQINQDLPKIACDSIFHSTKACEEFIRKYNLALLKRGSSLKICSLATGLADIYPRLNGTSEWDTAASDIILSLAGGISIDINTKQPLCYNKENIRNNHFIAFGKKEIQGKIYADVLA